jgi:hypothetical protein
MTSEQIIPDEKPAVTRTQAFAQWLMAREEAKKDVEVDKTLRMLKLNTFLTLAILAVVGGSDSTDLVMSLIWFI